jgi:nucleotide-binding universal stress UspA family protein
MPVKRPPVVVGVRYDDHASDAVELGVRLGHLLDAPLLLAAVYPPEPAIAPVPELAPEAPRRAEAALVRAAALVAEPSDVDLRAIPSRSAVQGMLELAESAAAIVVTSATAEQVVHASPCPVAVAPLGYGAIPRRPLRLVGCAFDGEPASQHALAAAVTLAARDRAALELIICVGTGSRRRRDARERGEQALARLDPRVAAELVVLEGDARELIAEHSADLDLLVCGSRGRRPVHAALSGGFTHHLVNRSHAPLLIVTERADAVITAW